MRKIYIPLSIVLFFILASLPGSLSAQALPVISPISGAATVCSVPGAGSTYSVSATNTPTSYNWSYNGPIAGVSFGTPSASVTAVNFFYPVLNATYTLYCYATNASGASLTSTFEVHVFETPNVTFSGANSFCQGSSTNLSASPTILSSSSTLSYSWMPSTGLSSTTGHSVNAQPPSSTNYTVLLTLGACSNTVMLSVIVNTCTVTGINTIAQGPSQDLQIYPNPSREFFVMQSSKDELAVILNEIGQTVRSFKLVAGTETRISNLPGGIYFVVTPSIRKKIVIME